MQCESPIRVSEICSRSGAYDSVVKRRILEKVASEEWEQISGFVFVKGKPIYPRNRKDVDDSSVRKAENVPAIEIWNLIMLLVKASIHCERGELVEAAARNLGILRTTKKWRDKLESVVDYGIRSGRLVEENGQVRFGISKSLIN